MLAVLDELGIERVKLVGHDWGGWIGFLLCLRAPERFDRFLALGIPHPWQTRRRRLAPAAALLVPAADHRPGARLLRCTAAAASSAPPCAPAATDRAAFDEPTLRLVRRQPRPARPRPRLRAAVPQLRPARARAADPRPLHVDTRLHVPTRLLLGTGDPAIGPALIAGWEPHADEMSVELVPGLRPLHRRRAPRAGRRRGPRPVRLNPDRTGARPQSPRLPCPFAA